jgi:beta-xylosidase
MIHRHRKPSLKAPRRPTNEFMQANRKHTLLTSAALTALVIVSSAEWSHAQTPASAPAEPYGAVHAPGYPKVIMPGDYPDPTIIRDGRDYYMTHSAFEYTPGFLIWHSTDLVNWRPVVRALKQTGSYAPDIAKVNGKFYIYYPAGGSNWVLTADKITGPWTKPANVGVGWHIDPGYAVGEDGKRYLFLSDGVRVPLSDDGLSAIGGAKLVYSGWEYPTNWVTECKCLEAPKVVRKGDYFYLISAEGGTAGPATSHMVVVARSKSINGPWENSPYNPLVHTYSADEQWWSKGHGTLIDDVNGNWWIVYHAYEKGLHTLGRQTLLDPIDWTQDGWPILAKTAHPLPPGDGTVGGMELSDNFSGTSLGLQWVAWRDYAGIQLKDGSLFLNAKGSGPADARLLLITATDAAYEVQVEVTVPSGGRGGLILFYNEKAFAGITSDGKEFTLYRDAANVTRQTNRFGGHFFLKIVNRKNRCTFLASADGKTWTSLLTDVDVSGLQHNKFGGFLALRPGLMAAGSSEVKFDHFVYKNHDKD